MKNYKSSGKAMIIPLTVRSMKKMSLYKISQHFCKTSNDFVET